jgi:hypothetical protein
MSEPDRPSPLENQSEARRWLAIVDEDLDVAIDAARISRQGASACHVQQAAEKLIKGLPVPAAEPFRCSHDLDDLATRLLLVVGLSAVRRSDRGRAPSFDLGYRLSISQPERRTGAAAGNRRAGNMIGMLKEFAAMAYRLLDAK